MKTILFPTDFSASALDALKYTVRFCNEMSVERLILYNSYDISHPEMIWVTDILVPMPSDIIELKLDAVHNFKTLKHTIQSLLNKNIALEYIADDRPLNTAIKEITGQYKVDLVAVALRGSTHEHQNKVGKQTFSIMQESDTSVLIIPKNTPLKKIERCMLACDLRSVRERLPTVQLKSILDKLHANLFVVNVDQKKSSHPYSFILEEQTLHHLLNDIKPEFHYIDHKNKVDAKINFAHEHKADLIIAVQRKRALLGQFFHHSLTQVLAIKTSIPLLILHKTE